MTQYSKIIYADLDVVLNTNIERWSTYEPFTTTYSGCGTDDYYHINGGFIVLKPSRQTYDELLKLAATEVPSKWAYSEQELLTVYYLFQHSQNTTILSKKHMMVPGLASSIEPKHSYANKNTKEELLAVVDSFHFTCSLKPWSGNGIVDDIAIKWSIKWLEYCAEAFTALHLGACKE
jgi:lipopolysaccharide biosynthesis glycosyltransferase